MERDMVSALKLSHLGHQPISTAVIGRRIANMAQALSQLKQIPHQKNIFTMENGTRASSRGRVV